jgi:hypothetical protein
MIEGEIKIEAGQRYENADGSVSFVDSVYPTGRVRFIQEGPSLGLGTPGAIYTYTLEDFLRTHDRLPPPAAAPAAAPAPAAARPPNPKTAFGAQKPDLSLIPPVALHHCALAFENGAAKYGPFNWRENSVEARTYVAASLRHLCDWLDGAEHSSDTSPPVHNLGHVMACCAILLDAQELGNLIDDRPLPGKSADVLERLKASKVRAAQARADTVRDEGPE